MKMSKRAEKALRKSIKHWEIDMLRDGKYPSGDDCVLCQEYFTNPTSINAMCSNCPLEIAKKGGCVPIHTKYSYAYNHNNTTEMKKQARRMIKFMKSLLPKKGEL